MNNNNRPFLFVGVLMMMVLFTSTAAASVHRRVKGTGGGGIRGEDKTSSSKHVGAGSSGPVPPQPRNIRSVTQSHRRATSGKAPPVTMSPTLEPLLLNQYTFDDDQKASIYDIFIPPINNEMSSTTLKDYVFVLSYKDNNSFRLVHTVTSALLAPAVNFDQ